MFLILEILHSNLSRQVQSSGSATEDYSTRNLNVHIECFSYLPCDVTYDEGDDVNYKVHTFQNTYMRQYKKKFKRGNSKRNAAEII
jgi:hypothetical protein